MTSTEASFIHKSLQGQLDLSHYQSILSKIDGMDEFTSIFKSIKDNGIEPDSFIYSLYFNILSGPQIMILHQYLDQQNLHSNKSIQALLHAMVDHPRLLVKIPFVWDCVKESDLKLTIDTIYSFLNASILCKDKDLFESMHKVILLKRNAIQKGDQSFKFDLKVYQTLLKGHDEFANARAVMRLFQEVMLVYPNALDRIIALYYLNALDKMGYHEDILQFSVKLNKNMMLSNEICMLLFTSFIKSNNTSQLLKWESIVKRRLDSTSNHEIDFRVTRGLIESFIKLKDLDKAMALFEYYVQSRKIAITIQNIALDLPYTTFDIAELFRNSDPILKRFREWTIDSPSRKDAAIIVGFLAQQKNVRLLEMMKELMSADVLYLHWVRIIRSKKVKEPEIAKLENKVDKRKIKNQKEFDRESGLVTSRLFKTDLHVGFEGPFHLVYRAIETGWGESTITGDVLGLDKLIGELETWERRCVLGCPIGNQFLGVEDTESGRDVPETDVKMSHSKIKTPIKVNRKSDFIFQTAEFRV